MDSTSDVEELESITANSVENMAERGLKPKDWEVYVDSDTGELWANVWFETGPFLNERRSFALAILKREIAENATRLPVYVNTHYEDNASDDGIAVWWWNLN